ncbi:MAG TPA: signal peptidase I [Streptosporangiaceae bacterium]
MPGHGARPGSAGEPGQPGRRAFVRSGLLLLACAAVFTIVTKAFVAQAFLVPTASMADTVRPGDRVLVNKLVYHFRGVARGDIVVFSGNGSWGPPPGPLASPVARWYRDVLAAVGLASNGTDYIKRVIGLPGDRVACCDARGRITVNGVPLNEGGYLYPGEQPSDEPFQVTVPPGRLWVMGDNRADSADSRDHPGDPGDGTIPETAVVGRALAVIWPPSQVRSLPIPATFAQPGLAARVAGAADPRSAAHVAGTPSPVRRGNQRPAGGDPVRLPGHRAPARLR